jgi:hypothetical protein
MYMEVTERTQQPPFIKGKGLVYYSVTPTERASHFDL